MTLWRNKITHDRITADHFEAALEEVEPTAEQREFDFETLDDVAGQPPVAD